MYTQRKQQSIGAITLWPTGDEQGGFCFYNLSTVKNISLRICTYPHMPMMS